MPKRANRLTPFLCNLYNFSMLIDTHAHLEMKEFDLDRYEVIKRAKEAGVGYLISVGATLSGSRKAVELSERYENVYASVGIHPHDVKEMDETTIQTLRELAKSPKVVAIGEIGLDYFKEFSPKDFQNIRFRELLSLARELDKPVIIHDRDAHEDTLRILKEEGIKKGVVHCFSGDEEFAKEILKLGFYISFTGVITFPKAEDARKVVEQVPIERIMVETDSPYLAPVPHRGKRNEPAFVREVAKTIAEIKELSFEDVSRITTLNVKELFGIDGAEKEVKLAYPIRDSLYLNITNRCTNRCAFCAKFKSYTVKGHYLELSHEPDFNEVITAIGDPSRYKEVVFCGYGEPLLRLDIVKEVAKWLKSRDLKVRINTDGLANLVHGRNILPELKGLVDSISVSLNAESAERYVKICRPPQGEAAYEAVKEFIKEAKSYILEVQASVVALPGVPVERCREIAEKELGVRFRAREYNEVG
ncbi:MAG: YchF/TatD family DNA exonuclease [Deltaproteobacteria bacterium]|nr:YchF/TatD family DNA exonuclease [Deltaproteobacteria bacterium]